MKQSLAASLKRFFRLRLKSGFGQFLINSAILVGVLFLENHFFPRAKVLIQLNVIGRTSAVLIFYVGLIFFMLERHRLYTLEKKPYHLKSLAIFFPIHLIFYFGFFYFKSFLIANPDLINQYFWYWVVLRYFLPIACVAFLGLAIFGTRLIKKFSKSIIIAFALAYAVFHLSFLFRQYWRFFSTLVTLTVAFLLKLQFPDVIYDLKDPIAPRLEVSGISMSIESPCSGVESMSLFILLYVFIVVLDRKVINKKRAVIAFFPGFLGMLLVDSLRIYSLYIMAILVSREFAIHQFHTNIGWVLFLCYFALFWAVSYNWLKKK